MSNLAKHPKDRFSHDTAQIMSVCRCVCIYYWMSITHLISGYNLVQIYPCFLMLVGDQILSGRRSALDCSDISDMTINR